MKQCTFCGEQNMEGMFYCEECGSPLTGEDVLQSNTTATQKLNQTDSGTSERPIWEHAEFNPGTSIYLLIKDSGEKVDIPPQTEVVFGRNDKRTNTYPDVDLTPYGGIDRGVSRQHAAIRRGTNAVVVLDLDSVNGTYLNGQRVYASQPRIIRDGDELRFGKLITQVYFK